jgi:branched-chain amino acid transport system permease protein
MTGAEPLTVFVLSVVELFQPSEFIGILVDALSKAALYIMIAAGLTVIFGLIGVVNFAHGSMTMLGAYVGGFLIAALAPGGALSLAAFVVSAATVFLVLAVAGGIMEKAFVKPVYDRSPIYHILLTLGVAFVLDELIAIGATLAGIDVISPWQAPVDAIPGFLASTYTVLGASFRGLDIFEILVGVVAVGFIWTFLNRTRYGMYIRACTEDAEMAEALGIDVPRTFTVVFGVGVGLTGIAGILLAWDVQGLMGQGGGATVFLSAAVLLPAFVVVIVGGLGSFEGTVLAGLVVGAVDAVATWLFVNEVVGFSSLPEISIFVLLVVALAVRPRGILGSEEVTVD